MRSLSPRLPAREYTRAFPGCKLRRRLDLRKITWQILYKSFKNLPFHKKLVRLGAVDAVQAASCRRFWTLCWPAPRAAPIPSHFLQLVSRCCGSWPREALPPSIGFLRLRCAAAPWKLLPLAMSARRPILAILLVRGSFFLSSLFALEVDSCVPFIEES